MKVILSKHAGFCYGVSRAVKMARELSETQKLATLGSLVHNKEVAREMEGRGIKKINTLDEVGDETVLIRSHGVPPEVFEEMEKRGINYVDCTCPSVKKIHQIVCENHAAGIKIIIIGDMDHPEITGIKGHGGNDTIVVGSVTEFQDLLPTLTGKYALVVQTTFRRDKLDSITDIIKKNNLDINIYDTICSATVNRQEEADSISKAVDYMVVIGDKNSSNTLKLVEICSKNCAATYLIETIEDLELNIFSTDVKIGVTAGASTPPDIIKEAVLVMSEMENTKNTQTFEEMLNESFVSLHTGDIVKGTVIQVANGEVSVNLGYKSDGIIPRSEFSEDPNVDPAEVLKPGDEIEVFIARVNDSEGNVLLSKKRLDANKSLKDIEEAFNNKETVRGKIIDVVRVGLIASINGVRAFVPSSQISNRYVEDLSQFKGKEFNFDVIEFDKSKRRIVVGRKFLAAKELKESKERIFSTLEIGQTVRGTVNRIVDFGAFIDLGGIDGLVHISELSWGRVKKVTDVLKEGDEVDVTVININKEKGKISLSLKDVKNNPWNSVNERYSIGQVVEGKVVRMVPFGAFVELEEGIDGLIHISQIATKHVVKPEDELKIGEVVKVKITDINQENNRISLSKKEIDLENEKLEEGSAEEETADNSVEPEAVVEEAVTEEAVAEEAAAETVEEAVVEEVEEAIDEAVSETVEEIPAEETN